MFCIKCGKQIKEGAKFCMNCGAVVPDINSKSDNKKINASPNHQNLIIGALIVICVVLVGTIVYGVFLEKIINI